MLVRKFPKLSRLEIEHMMQSDPEELSKEAKKIQKDFVELLVRSIVVALRMITSSFFLKNVYVSGGIAQTSFLAVLQTQFEAHLANPSIKIHSLIPEEANLDPNYGVAYALAKTTQELVRHQADPIARILRYVIYRYE